MSREKRNTHGKYFPIEPRCLIRSIRILRLGRKHGDDYTSLVFHNEYPLVLIQSPVPGHTCRQRESFTTNKSGLMLVWAITTKQSHQESLVQLLSTYPGIPPAFPSPRTTSGPEKLLHFLLASAMVGRSFQS